MTCNIEYGMENFNELRMPVFYAKEWGFDKPD